MRELKYMDELNEFVRNINKSPDAVSKESVQELLMIFTDEYLCAYQEKNYEFIREMLREQRNFRKELTAALRKYSDQTIIVASKMVQTYNIFNKILIEESERRNFVDEMNLVMQSYSHAKEVLRYLYKHSFVRHKEIKEKYNIPGSTLSDLLKILQQLECIECMKNGKVSLYNLTNEGCKYVEETIEGLNDEIIIEPEEFKAGYQKITRGKLQMENRIDNFYKKSFYYKGEIYDELSNKRKWSENIEIG